MMYFSFLNSPITRAELRYQRQVFQQPRWWHWLVNGVYFITAVLFCSLLWNTASYLYGAYSPPGISESTQGVLLVVPALVTHFAAVLRTLMVASESIAREKRNGTWDTLLTTGIDAHQIVWGKWWATVVSTWHDYLLPGFVRVAAIFWLSSHLDIILGSYYNPFGFLPFPINPYGLPLVVVVVFFLSVANAGVTAAFGVLPSQMSQSGERKFGLAVLLRVVTLLGLGTVIAVSGTLLLRLPYSESQTLAWGLFQVTAITLVDNGSVLATRMMVNYFGPILLDIHLLAALVMSVDLYVVIIWALLRLAQALAVRQGALPPARTQPGAT